MATWNKRCCGGGRDQGGLSGDDVTGADSNHCEANCPTSGVAPVPPVPGLEKTAL